MTKLWPGRDAHATIPTHGGACRSRPLRRRRRGRARAERRQELLIGKLEGPEVVTDAAKLPKAFKEAPLLAELVKAGKLPPVAERIGQDPLVIKPLHEIGKYGGTWRARLHRPGDLERLPLLLAARIT